MFAENKLLHGLSLTLSNFCFRSLYTPYSSKMAGKTWEVTKWSPLEKRTGGGGGECVCVGGGVLAMFLRDWGSYKKILSHNLLGLGYVQQLGSFIWWWGWGWRGQICALSFEHPSQYGLHFSSPLKCTMNYPIEQGLLIYIGLNTHPHLNTHSMNASTRRPETHSQTWITDTF